MKDVQALHKDLTSLLPRHLGLGRLDAASISGDADEIQAEYRAADDLIYIARLNRQACRIEEFDQGQSIGVSEQPEFTRAFFTLPSLYRPLEHPRIARLFARVLSSGWNIRLLLPLKVTHLFFPSGLIFSLNLPVTDANRRAWEALKTREEARGEGSRLHFASWREGRSLEGFSYWKAHLDVKSVTLIPLLIELEETLTLLCESGVLLEDKDHPLVITL